MRDILSDLETGPKFLDPDRVRRGQGRIKTELPKRFYKEVSTAAGEGGFRVLLDGRAARTPGRAQLALPSEAVAALVAEEFAAQGERIDPVTMPPYRLVNSAIDGVATDVGAVVEDIGRYAGSDLVCYRADGPERLQRLQAEAWDPVVDWARRELGARFFLAEGVMHVAQPAEAIAAVEDRLKRHSDPFRVAALHLVTTITGSVLIALMVESGSLSADEAWRAAHVDEDWNISQWGEDDEAIARREFRHRDFLAAMRLIELT